MKTKAEKWENLSDKEQQAILDFWENGPDCAKFLSRRIRMPLSDTMALLSDLEKTGWLERVQGTFLFKKGFKRPKHMNHTYYKLTKQVEKELRFLARKGRV